jgi:hypothetical protein
MTTRIEIAQYVYESAKAARDAAVEQALKAWDVFRMTNGEMDREADRDRYNQALELHSRATKTAHDIYELTIRPWINEITEIEQAEQAQREYESLYGQEE